MPSTFARKALGQRKHDPADLCLLRAETALVEVADKAKLLRYLQRFNTDFERGIRYRDRNYKKRLEDNEAAPYEDRGHDKSIVQAKNRVLNAAKMVAKHCKPDPDTLADLAALGITLAVLILLITLAPESLIALIPALGKV